MGDGRQKDRRPGGRKHLAERSWGQQVWAEVTHRKDENTIFNISGNKGFSCRESVVRQLQYRKDWK